jgi:hypothetical protein
MFSTSKNTSKRAHAREERHARRVWCKICGRPVRSGLGEVCNKPSCHTRYLDKFGD